MDSFLIEMLSQLAVRSHLRVEHLPPPACQASTLRQAVLWSESCNILSSTKHIQAILARKPWSLWHSCQWGSYPSELNPPES